MMRHTFLFEPAVWTATGTFWRGDGEALEASGKIEVAHRPECWLLSGTLKVQSAPPVEFVYAYRIQPPNRESGTMRWTSEDPTLGKLHGTYTVIGETIFSIYRCEGTGYYGAEHLGRVDGDCYHWSGLLLLDDRCLSSRQLLIRRLHRTP
jgi:hypothetical protein